MTETEIAAESGRCHRYGWNATSYRCDAPQSAQSGVNPMPLQNARAPLPDRIAELEHQLAAMTAERDAADAFCRNRVAELECRNDRQYTTILELLAQRDAMTAERDHAVLRMEVAIATSHAWIDAEVRRRIAEAEASDNSTPRNPRPDGSYGTPQHDPEAPGKPPPPHSFPSRALRHQRQSGGLLSTADAGRVRLGGYAPSLPPR